MISDNIDEIRRVRIVDDSPEAREAYSYSVEDLNLKPILVHGPLQSLNEFIDETTSDSDALICDYQLRIKNYAQFNGTESVAKLYQVKFPAVLCTKWEDASIDDIRLYRQFIPVLLKPQDLNPSTLEQGFRKCISEFRGEFLPSRRGWRSLVRVEGVDRERRLFYTIVPGWDPNQVIRLRLEIAPTEVQHRILDENQVRFHANINIGAEHQEELFFTDWEND